MAGGAGGDIAAYAALLRHARHPVYLVPLPVILVTSSSDWPPAPCVSGPVLFYPYFESSVRRSSWAVALPPDRDSWADALPITLTHSAGTLAAHPSLVDFPEPPPVVTYTTMTWVDDVQV